jgi:nicotinamidase-related amidase
MVKMIEGRAAVVVIDVQYDFLPGGAIPAVGRWEIAPGINRLTNAGR